MHVDYEGLADRYDEDRARFAVPRDDVREALADAERRVVSQLVLLDDDAYARGLARLRRAAETPGATVTTSQALLRLTADAVTVRSEVP